MSSVARLCYRCLGPVCNIEVEDCGDRVRIEAAAGKQLSCPTGVSGGGRDTPCAVDLGLQVAERFANRVFGKAAAFQVVGDRSVAEPPCSEDVSPGFGDSAVVDDSGPLERCERLGAVPGGYPALNEACIECSSREVAAPDRLSGRAESGMAPKCTAHAPQPSPVCLEPDRQSCLQDHVRRKDSPQLAVQLDCDALVTMPFQSGYARHRVLRDRVDLGHLFSICLD
jgi:hypothetical protein